jgi:DNA-binding HxlR family transcriptional regulator
LARATNRLPPLPVERALKVISGRWKAVILYFLLGGPKRLSELARLAPEIRQKVLIQQLRDLEAHGVVTRTVFAETPPRVEYAATDLGRSLEPIMLALCAWGSRHAQTLAECARDCIIKPSSVALASPTGGSSAVRDDG